MQWIIVCMVLIVVGLLAYGWFTVKRTKTLSTAQKKKRGIWRLSSNEASKTENEEFEEQQIIISNTNTATSSISSLSLFSSFWSCIS